MNYRRKMAGCVIKDVYVVRNLTKKNILYTDMIKNIGNSNKNYINL